MSMLLESQTLPRIENKALEFTIDIQDGQFNHGGWYYLLITLHNSFTTDFSKVTVMRGDSGEWESTRTIQTDFTKQEESSPLSFFKDKKFTFRMPKGFCKNDNNHDVYLLVEAFSSDTEQGQGKKVGEGKFAIYPRNNAPRMKLYVEPGEDYYNFSAVMSLLRTHSTDNIQMHCGRIRNNYSLCELVPPKPKSVTPPLEQFTPRQLPDPTPTPHFSSPTPRSYRLDPPVRPTPTPFPTPKPVTKPPTPSSWGDNLSLDINIPKSPPLPPAADGRKIPERPLNEEDRHTFYTDHGYRHVANLGKEHIEVICHGANTLPGTSDGQTPQPYTVVKTKTDDDANRLGGVTTHSSYRPTHTPSWEEMVTLQINESFANDETLVVCVADGPSQRALVDYKIPIAHLTPFHQYHMEFNMPAYGNPSGVKQFVSITRKQPKLPRDSSCPNYLALEVLLMNVQRPIKSPLGPLIAVARIVPDYYNYKTENLVSQPRNAGVTMNNVTFPSAHPSNFVVTDRSQHGHPQLSLPGRPSEQPRWMHPYLFVEKRDKATLFTPGAALIIEYYVASMGNRPFHSYQLVARNPIVSNGETENQDSSKGVLVLCSPITYTVDPAMSDQFWRMQSPIAFSSILMDEEMYKYLTEERARHGLRVENIPMQGSELVTEDGRKPTVGVILRLITTETPDSMGSVSNLEDIPSLDLYPAEGPGYYRSDTPEEEESEAKPETPLSPPHTPQTPPDFKKRNTGRYLLQKIRKRPMTPIKDGDLPSYNAMDSVLPDYQYIFQPGSADGGPPQKGMEPKPGTSKLDDDLEKNSLFLLDHQTQELGNYRGAVHKMGQDIIVLQSNIRELEGVNSNLRRDLAHYNDASRLMVDSAELDGLTKPEVLSRYAALKQTLASQTSDLKGYKEKLQHVQNELIQKNDMEKEYLKMQKAHSSQLIMIQKLQERLKKMKMLETACKKQEDVIIKMEKVLEKHNRDRNRMGKDKAMQEANEALLQENKRLRAEIDELRLQLRNNGSNQKDDMERFELYQALERAEARIAALERQLTENSRSWGKERADMNLRLNEAEHGFGRSAGMVLHDYPVFNDIPKSNLKRLSPVYR